MSKITSKGQVTIPKEIRDDFGFLPGTEIEFVRDGDDIRVRKLPGGRSRGDEIVERLRKAGGGKYKLSTEEIMRLTRGENWGQGA